MSRFDLPRPAWPVHHDGKPLTRHEVATHDPALARRLTPSDLFAASLFDLGCSLNRVQAAQFAPPIFKR